MSNGQNKVTVDGINYEFGQISPRVLKPEGIKFLKMVAPTLSGILDFSDIQGSYSKAIEEALHSLDQNQYMEFEKLLFSEAFHRGGSYKGQSVEACGHLHVDHNYDKAFDRKLMHSFKVLFEALRYYYNDFFTDGVNLVTKIKNLAGSLQETK